MAGDLYAQIHAELFAQVKRRLWNLVGAVVITEAEAEELCRLIRTRARVADTDARDREAVLAVDERWCEPRGEG
jgi:trehalose utilization protein